jgi:hypothetical protein
LPKPEELKEKTERNKIRKYGDSMYKQLKHLNPDVRKPYRQMVDNLAKNKFELDNLR